MSIVIPVMLTPGCRARIDAPDLRIAYQHAPVSLDPYGHDDAVTRAILGAVYEPLVALTSDLEPAPGLATRWVSPNPATWRLHLRDAEFHDGRVLTPDDVVLSLERAKSTSASASAPYLAQISSIEVVPNSPREIIIRTRGPMPTLLTRLALIPIVPPALEVDRPNGTGPYRMTHVGVDSLSLERFDRYWGEPAAAPHVSVTWITSGEVLRDALEHDLIDVMASVAPELVRDVSLGPEWQVVDVPSMAVTMLGFNLRHAPFDDPRVREAIDLALDPQSLARFASPAGDVEVVDTLLPPEVFGASSRVVPRRFDPERARVLLQAADIPHGTVISLDHSGAYRSTVSAIVRQLAAVGLDIHPIESSYEEFYQRLVTGDGDLFLVGWNFPVADAADFLDAVIHSYDPGRGYGTQNGSGYASPRVDRLIEESAREPSLERRLEMLAEIMTQLEVDRPYLPLYRRNRKALVRRPWTFEPRIGWWVRPQDLRPSALGGG